MSVLYIHEIIVKFMFSSIVNHLTEGHFFSLLVVFIPDVLWLIFNSFTVFLFGRLFLACRKPLDQW